VRNGHLWLEHYPDGVTSRVLNAHLYATFGLFECWELTRSPRARWVLEGAITTVRDTLARFRRPGRASRYSLSSASEISKRHGIHIRQLRLLAHVTGVRYFSKMAAHFQADLDPPGPGRFCPGPLR
jgi:hypothetical protein